jgi:hypothetical protein
MNMRLSIQGLYVDPVLGWAARVDDARAAGPGAPAVKDEPRLPGAKEQKAPSAEGEER